MKSNVFLHLSFTYREQLDWCPAVSYESRVNFFLGDSCTFKEEKKNQRVRLLTLLDLINSVNLVI
jgi:hypothetical protein